MRTIFLAMLFFLSAASTFAQDETSSQLTEPETPYLFSQYHPNDITTEDEIQKIELFVMQIKNTWNTNGRIYVYRGKTDYQFDAEKRSDTINKILTPLLEKNSMESYRAYSIFGGFRDESTIEMVIDGRFRSTATPTVSLSDLKFYAAALPNGTIQKTQEELLNDLTKKVEPPFPAAAKAVRQAGEVGVLIKIDEKGKVIEARAFTGYVLLRSACVAAVRQWQFKPQKYQKKPVNTVGIVSCKFVPE
jgi:TonB family protein